MDDGSFLAEAIDLGPFLQGFAVISGAVCKSAPEVRLKVFKNGAMEATQFVRKGLAKQTAVDKLVGIADAYGIDRMEAEHVIAEAFKQAERNEGAARKPKRKAKVEQANGEDENAALPSASEEAIALRFAERHAGELRYVAAWGRWLTYDGTRWQHDDTLNVFDRVRALCREVASSSNNKPKLASIVASGRTVASIERLSRSDRRLAATIDQWDADPWLLNTSDGTVDLRSGDVRTHDPIDFVTKQTTCHCAPIDTPHPVWTAFLNRITNNDRELQDFLQRYCGYCLTGITTEHAFVFAFGTGANGKSTFVNTIAGIFGDYATVADMTTFLANNNEKHPTDLAKLNGARLTTAQETAKGRRWDEVRIKALTGGDRITARFMRQDYFDFTPVLKLLISGNHKPRLGTIDEAMRRRFLLVPFTVQIPANERDLGLLDKLKAEWPAILRWCVDGCLQWQRLGLAPPTIVHDASEAYFEDQDTLGQWLFECTYDAGPAAFSTTKELFASWKFWCEGNNQKPGTSQFLSEMLSARGYRKKREGGTGRQGFVGLAVGVRM